MLLEYIGKWLRNLAEIFNRKVDRDCSAEKITFDSRIKIKIKLYCHSFLLANIIDELVM